MNARIASCCRIAPHLTPYRLLELSQRRKGTVRVLEDRGAGYQNGRPRGHDARGVLGLDPSIHLELCAEVTAVERLADGFDLPERALDELLTTEAGVNAHHEREVHGGEMRENCIDRRLRIQRQTGSDTASADRGERPGHVRRRLDMEGEVGR